MGLSFGSSCRRGRIRIHWTPEEMLRFTRQSLPSRVVRSMELSKGCWQAAPAHALKMLTAIRLSRLPGTIHGLHLFSTIPIAGRNLQIVDSPKKPSTLTSPPVKEGIETPAEFWRRPQPSLRKPAARE